MRGCQRLFFGLLVFLMLPGIGQAIPQLMNYQGLLTDDSGTPITATTTVEFRIWDSPAGGTELWMESQSVTPDAQGLFNVLLGSVNPIPGSALAGAEAYVGLTIDSGPELMPRTQVVAVAYAFRTETVDGAMGGTISGDVSITGRATIGPGHINTGTGAFAAGQNNTVSGEFSVVSGGYNNEATGNVTSIGGGGVNVTTGIFSTISGGEADTASQHHATISGGLGNTAGGAWSTVGGGQGNRAFGINATISGGVGNETDARSSAVGGGKFNAISGAFSTIGGGESNTAAGDHSAIPGGFSNQADGLASLAAGYRAKALHGGSFVWADSTDADFASTGGNQFLVRAEGGVGINLNDPTADLDINGQLRIRGGSPAEGKVLTSSADGTAAWTDPSAVADNDWTLIDNVLYTGGGWSIARPGNTIRGTDNTNTHVDFGFVSITGETSSPVGYCTISGGRFNNAGGGFSTVGGGDQNGTFGYGSTVSGGAGNIAYGEFSTIGGGDGHEASGYESTVSGGAGNSASGLCSSVPGGRENEAAGKYSLAAGWRAKALHAGSFVWADSTNADFASTGANQFLIRAGTGVGINVNDPTADLDINGQLRIRGGSPGAGKILTSSADGTAAWTNPSSIADNDWTLTDDVLYTGGGWSIARAGNTIDGLGPNTHVNLGYGCTTGGGPFPSVGFCTVSGGKWNAATGDYSTSGGGGANQASGSSSTIGGGSYNTASGPTSTVSGGSYNDASGSHSTIGGGNYNDTGNEYSTVGGGLLNNASGECSTIPGGFYNAAAGYASLAAGCRAKANHRGTFVWADSMDADFASTGDNQFIIRAGGGVGIGTNSPGAGLHVKGSGFPKSFGYFDTDSIYQDAGLRFYEAGVEKSHLFHQAGTNTLNLYGDGYTGISINADGEVGIGTTAPNYTLDVRGTIGNFATLYHSDRRWKDNIQTLSNSLDKVQQLRGVSFDWKRDECADMNFPEGRQIGLIAQEVEEVIPEVVSTAAGGYKSIDYAKLVALLIEANKEQQKQIDELREQLAKFAAQANASESPIGMK